MRGQPLGGVRSLHRIVRSKKYSPYRAVPPLNLPPSSYPHIPSNDCIHTLRIHFDSNYNEWSFLKALGCNPDEQILPRSLLDLQQKVTYNENMNTFQVMGQICEREQVRNETNYAIYVCAYRVTKWP